MADSDSIVIALELAGEDEVQKAFSGLEEAGTKAFKSIGAAAQGLNLDHVASSVQKAVSQIATAKSGAGGAAGGGQELDGIRQSLTALFGSFDIGSEALHTFAEGLHVLHPILGAVGIEMGNLRSFALLARAGVGALGAALVGVLVASVERARDAINDEAAKIGSISGEGPKSGIEQRQQLNETGAQLGIQSGKLVEPYEQLLRANQLNAPKDQLDKTGQQDVLKTLFEGAQLDKAPSDKASSTITDFLTNLRKGGSLTPEIAAAAGEVMPTLMTALLNALKEQNPNETIYSSGQTLQALKGIGPEIKERLEGLRNIIPEGIEESWERVKASFDKLTKVSGSKGYISSVLGGVADAIENLADNWTRISSRLDALGKTSGRGGGAGNEVVDSKNELIDFIIKRFAPERKPGSGLPDVGPSPLDRAGDELYKSLVPERKQGEGLPDVGRPAFDIGGNATAQDLASSSASPALGDLASKAKDAANAAGEAATHLRDVGDGSATFQKTIAAYTEQVHGALDVIGAKLNTQQAAIGAKFAQPEEDLKLEQDKFAVEQSQLAKREAVLSIADAQKNVALSQFAEGDSHDRLLESQLSERKAQDSVGDAKEAFQRKLEQGGATHRDFEKFQTGEDEELLRLKQAKRATEKAKVEDQFADLVPQHAQLELEKAVQGARGTDFLQRENSLKLARDEAGRSLPADVATLKYADAQLKEIEEIRKGSDVQVSALKEISQKLTGSKEDSPLAEPAKNLDSAAEKLSSAADKIGNVGKSPDEIKKSEDAKAAKKKAQEEALKPHEFPTGPEGVGNAQRDNTFKPVPVTPPPNEWPTGPEAAKALQDRRTNKSLQTVDDIEAQRQQALREGRNFGAERKAGPPKEEDQTEAFNRDREQQRKFSRSIAEQGGQPSVSDNYKPAIPGHYDEKTGGFVQDGQPHPYSGGAPQPLSFPHASQAIPLPQARPEGANTPFESGFQESLTQAVKQGVVEGESQKQTQQPEQPHGSSGTWEETPKPAEEGGGLLSGLQQLFQGLNSQLEQLHNSLHQNDTGSSNTNSDATAQSEEALGSAADEAKSGISSLSEALGQLAGAVQSAAAAMASASSEATSESGAGTTGFASGGHVTGPGSGTSDSIPAMLSHGEFVHNASAVGHYGVDFMHAVNNLTLPKFSLGGLVRGLTSFGFAAPPVAAFSSGGFVSAPQPNNSNNAHMTVDFRTDHGDFNGLLAPDHVAKQMSRAAVQRQNVQTGNKPGWYRGKS